MKRKYLIRSYLEKFAYSLVLFLFTFVGVFQFTVLNKNFIESQFDDEHYQNIENSLKAEMKRSMISSGLDDEIIDDMFTKADLENTVSQILTILYDNSSFEFDTSNVEEKLRANIIFNLEKNNFQLDDEKGYNRFVDSIMDIYKGEFVMLNRVKKIGSLVSTLKKYSVVLFICLFSLLSVLTLLFRKRITRILPVALFTSCFLILFGIAYIEQRSGISSITIISVTFSELLRRVVHDVFSIYQVIAIAYFIVGFVLLLFRKSHRHHHHS